MEDKHLIPVDELITSQSIPESLNIVNTNIGEFLSQLFVADLETDVSVFKDYSYFSFTLISFTRIGFEIPGTDGLMIVLNPGELVTARTEIPMTIAYKWEILKFMEFFKVEDFDFSLAAIFDLLVVVLKTEPRYLLLQTIDENYPWTDDHHSDDDNVISETDIDNRSPIEKFIDDFNLTNNLSTPLYSPVAFDNIGEDNDLVIIDSLIDQLTLNNFNVYEVIFNYILHSDIEIALHKMESLFSFFSSDFTYQSLKNLIIPEFSIGLPNINLALQFPRTIFKPIDIISGEVIQDEEIKSQLIFNAGSLYFSSRDGFEFEELANFSFTKSEIGNTGLLIEFDNVKLDLSADSNIPEAIVDNRPDTFKGMYAEHAAITLPKKWFKNENNPNTTLRLAGYNMLIGTGGLSGVIALEAVIPNNPIGISDYLWVKIGNSSGFELGFNHFDLTFRQNVIVESNIKAALKINKLKNQVGQPLQIDVVGHLYEDGDFNLTASVEGGVQANLFNFVNFNFLTLELGRQDDDFYIGTSCEIWFTNAIMTKLIGNQKIVLPNIRVYSNGSIEIVGGTSVIPTNISLNLGPVEVAVTGIHFGSYEQNGRKYNYWGFDGSISINPLGIDARGEGIKYYYTTDNDEHGGNGDSFIRIQTIEVDLVIPGNASPATAAAIIHGMISIPQPGESPEYRGEVSIKLPKAKIAGGASMRLQPKAPAFLIDAYVDLPAPIPIGPVGIYGFRGLIGYRYVAEKEAVGLVSGVNTWYDYYKFPPRGIHESKFSGPERTKDYSFPFSVGVGAVLGTSFDSGTIISIRAMMVLSLPTVFMIDGRASIISARLGLDDTKEPPFFAFVAWGDNSIEMGMGADFKLPQNTGKILSLQAQVESRFMFNNASAWYVNIGTRQNPNTASLFKDLINLRALSYLMIAAQGIEAGARVDFELKKNFFGIKVEIYAFVEMGGRVSFERPQIGGYLHFGGGIKVNVWRILFIGFDMNAYLSAEAVKPFLIFAKMEFHGKIRVLRFLKIRFSIRLQLKWEVSSEVDTTPVPALPYQTVPANNTVDRSRELVKGVHMLTNDTYDLNYLGVNLASVNHSNITEVIPLDTYIDIKSTKGLIGNALSSKIGGYTMAPSNYNDLIPPQKTVAGGHVLRQVKHQYSIEEIEIKAWNGSQWINYHPYEALFEAGVQRNEVADLRIGYWQLSNKQYDTIRLLATNPFSYLDPGEPGWFTPEYYGITASTLFCQVPQLDMQVADVLNKAIGTIYHYSSGSHYINGVYFRATGDYGTVDLVDVGGVAVDTLEVTDQLNPHNFPRSLSFTNYNSLAITLPEDSVRIELKLSSDSGDLKIKYYKSYISQNLSQVQFQLVSEVVKTQSQLSNAVIYNDPAHPIIRIIVEPVMPQAGEIAAIREQIEALFADTYSSSDGVVSISMPADIILYDQLQEQLIQLLSTGCAQPGGGGSACEGMDETLCSLYDSLVELYCFVPVTSSTELNVECYNAFIQFIKEFEQNYPGLIQMLEPFYSDYVKWLQTLEQHIKNGATEEDILQAYEQLYLNAHNIMQVIYGAGDCGCATEGAENGNESVTCTTSFQEIRWLTLDRYQYNQLIPGADAQMQDQLAMVQAVESTVQPIWRPNTKYYIRFRIKDKIEDPATEHSFNYFYGFKTSGGVGHFAEQPQLKGLNSLAKYIDFNRSYPNADGNLLQAKPLYWGHYECKISIFFTKPFTYHMLNNWAEYNGLSPLQGSINIKIKDPVSGVLIPYPLPVSYNESTVPVPVGNGDNATEWSSDTNPLIPAGLGLLNNLIAAGNLPCVLNIGDPLAPASYVYTIKLTNLKPQKLYTALIYNAFDADSNQGVGANENAEVHNFVFQTSRYENFSNQVNSYVLSDGEGQTKDAVFNLPISSGLAAINNAYAIVSGSNVNVLPGLSQDYSHAFDRVLEGILLLKPLEFPATTEFNCVRNDQSGDLVALIVRSPEPFNNPKIPVAEMSDTIVVLNSQGQPDPDYNVLFSKDYSQAIIMNSGNSIMAGSLQLRFRYKAWNGTSYVQEGADVIVTINL